MMQNKLFVIDGSGFIFRAYYGIRIPMTSINGENVNAVYGFIKMLSSLLKDHKPSHLAIAFDPNEASFRNDFYPLYKANRPSPPPDLPKQYELCIEATKAFNIPALSCPKMEADDVIGTLVTQWPGESVIVSADKDMSQLVNERVSLWDGKDGQFLDRMGVLEKMGVYPEQIIDYLGIAGDSSDNIPGVPGIGPKGAIQLLAEYQNLENILANAHLVKGKKGEALKEFADQARLSARLATIKLDAPLQYDPNALAYQLPHFQALNAFFKQMRFKSLAQEFNVTDADIAKRLSKLSTIESHQQPLEASLSKADHQPQNLDEMKYQQQPLEASLSKADHHQSLDMPSKNNKEMTLTFKVNPTNQALMKSRVAELKVNDAPQQKQLNIAKPKDALAENHIQQIQYDLFGEHQITENQQLQDYYSSLDHTEEKRSQTTQRVQLIQSQKALIDPKKYQSITTLADLDNIVQSLAHSSFFSLDLETTSLDAYEAQIVGISLCWADNQAVYIPLLHYYLGVTEQLSSAIVWDKLKDVLENPSIGKIGQNIKFEQKIFSIQGIVVNGWIGDTMLMAYLLESDRNSFDLSSLSNDYLGYQGLSFKEVVSKGENFSGVDIEKATIYSAEDADLTYRLYCLFLPYLQKDAQLLDLYQRIELPLSRVLAKMENHGIRIDASKLIAQSTEMTEEINVLKKEIYQLSGYEFNIDSPKQLSELLYQKLKLQAKKKKEVSTKQEVLEGLIDQHPIIPKLLDYRHLAKLQNTYIDTLPKLIHPKTQRVHTSFKQTGTVTGRLSSQDPNLQNIPTKTQRGKRIREAFVAAQGQQLISADYSQVELRLLAHFAQSKHMLQAFTAGADIHKQTASQMFSIPIDQVSSDQRRQAKAINFGLMYGMGPSKLAQTLGVEFKIAKHLIDIYFKEYKDIHDFFQVATDEVRMKGYSSTLLGRKRYLYEINSSNASERSQAERLALNTPIQGTAADILKLAMVKLDQQLEEKYPNAKLLLTVHDELLVEAPIDQAQELARLMKETMETAISLSVPLTVEVGIGQSWAEIH